MIVKNLEGNMSSEKKPSVVIIGAGRLGKGFIGEVFDKANWQVIFVDKCIKVVEELRTGSYKVRITGEKEVSTREVSNYQTIYSIGSKEFEKAFLESNLVMIPVYPEDLDEVFTDLVPSIQKMYEEDSNKKIDLVLLTNQIGLVEKLYGLLQLNVTKELYDWIQDHLFIRDSIIRRSTDASSNTSLNIHSIAIASLLIEKPIHVSLKNVDWMETVGEVQKLKKLKLFMMNGPHAAAAFMGKYKGYNDILDAQNDSEIAILVEKVTNEIYSACKVEFDLDTEKINSIIKLPEENQNMHDSTFRIAFDPIRKLAIEDRLCGPIMLAEKNKLNHIYLDKAVAYGFKYYDKEDPNAVKLQEEIKGKGIFSTVQSVTGLEDNVVCRIVEEYEKL